MKKLYVILVALIATTVMVSCQKDTDNPPVNNTVLSDPLAGLGSTPGYPIGKEFLLPDNISIIGQIRGGLSYKAPWEKTFKGPFILENKASYVTLGTGTYVNLYITFFNSGVTNTTFTMPGGLIFVDSSDIFQHIPIYQKGYILQDVQVTVNALDTAFIQLRAYCLNHTLAPSSYLAVYYIGPITGNAQLNTITGIMSTKQYPIGEEYNIQSIIWNVTDYGQTLTAQEITYLNGLP